MRSSLCCPGVVYLCALHSAINRPALICMLTVLLACTHAHKNPNNETLIPQFKKARDDFKHYFWSCGLSPLLLIKPRRCHFMEMCRRRASTLNVRRKTEACPASSLSHYSFSSVCVAWSRTGTKPKSEVWIQKSNINHPLHRNGATLMFQEISMTVLVSVLLMTGGVLYNYRLVFLHLPLWSSIKACGVLRSTPLTAHQMH